MSQNGVLFISIRRKGVFEEYFAAVPTFYDFDPTATGGLNAQKK